MNAALLTILSLVSLVLFPWPMTVLLALLTAGVEPLAPLGIGLLADTLYYAPHVGRWPLFTLGGVVATAIAVWVQSRLRTSSMGR